jgi:hypothetical protein
MPLTPRLAKIIAEMIDAKLDAESRRETCAGSPDVGTAAGEMMPVGRSVKKRIDPRGGVTVRDPKAAPGREP